MKATPHKNIAHVIGFDDAPFPRDHRGDVTLIGAAFAGERLEGVLCGKVRRDGANATSSLLHLILHSRYAEHTRLIMLQGIAFAGFNVVDMHGLHEASGIPVLVVARRQPHLARIKKALLTRVPGGRRKWRLIEKAGPMEHVAGVYVQRAGMDLAMTRRVIVRHARHGLVPEPLRTAHLIASAIGGGSHQRV